MLSLFVLAQGLLLLVLFHGLRLFVCVLSIDGAYRVVFSGPVLHGLDVSNAPISDQDKCR